MASDKSYRVVVSERAAQDVYKRQDIAGQMDLSGYALGLILTVLMFFAIYYYGYGVSMSVATEKASRVMETLVVSAKPSRLLIGKCLAMGCLLYTSSAGRHGPGAWRPWPAGPRPGLPRL